MRNMDIFSNLSDILSRHTNILVSTENHGVKPLKGLPQSSQDFRQFTGNGPGNKLIRFPELQKKLFRLSVELLRVCIFQDLRNNIQRLFNTLCDALNIEAFQFCQNSLHKISKFCNGTRRRGEIVSLRFPGNF